MLTFATWLRRFADWLSPIPAVVVVEDPLLALARIAVAKAETRHLHPKLKRSTRAKGLVRLLTAQRTLEAQEPNARLRDIRLAIEKAIQETP